MASLKGKIAKEIAERLKAGDELAMDFASRMQRAADQGFDTSNKLFHGSDSDIKSFDASKLGSSTGSSSAEQGVWLTSSPDTARSYAEFKARSVPVQQKLREADIAEAAGDWDLYDKKLVEAESLEAAIYDEPRRGQNITQALTTGRFKEFDAGGNEFMDIQDDVNSFISQAQKEGFEGATFKNLADDVGFSGRPSTHQVVFDPKNIRSVNAAFDPTKKESSNLLAGLGAGVVAGGAALAPQDAEASFIGKMAKTFSKPAQEMAEKMAKLGKSRDEIWKATGDEFGMPTYKDVDGHWKQETDDSSLAFDKYKRASFGGYTDYDDRLGDAVRSPLLDAYPDMKSYEQAIIATNNPSAEIGGAFEPKARRLRATEADEAGALSTTAHEMQHGAQHIEGFAQGGSQQTFAYDYNKNLSNINYYQDQKVNELLKARKSPEYLANEQDIKDAIGLDDKESLRDLLSKRRAFERDATSDISREIVELENKNRLNPFEKYERLAGEAEARNVQARLNMPMNERIDKAPWTTLDVPEDELIVRGNRLNALGGGIGATSLGALTATQDASAQPRSLASLISMEGEPYRPDTIQGSRSLGGLGSIADLIESADRNIDGPANMIVPAGTAEYIRKLQYGDDIGYLDRLLANPLL